MKLTRTIIMRTVSVIMILVLRIMMTNKTQASVNAFQSKVPIDSKRGKGIP